MDNILLNYLSQLATQVPMLFVFLIGMILPLMFWSRCPGPSMLTLLAMGLLLVVSLLQPLVFLLVIHSQADSNWDPATRGWVLSASGIVGSLFRAAAFGMLLAAVFTGREARRPIHHDAAFKPTA